MEDEIVPLMEQRAKRRAEQEQAHILLVGLRVGLDDDAPAVGHEIPRHALDAQQERTCGRLEPRPHKRRAR